MRYSDQVIKKIELLFQVLESIGLDGSFSDMVSKSNNHKCFFQVLYQLDNTRFGLSGYIIKKINTTFSGVSRDELKTDWDILFHGFFIRISLVDDLVISVSSTNGVVYLDLEDVHQFAYFCELIFQKMSLDYFVFDKFSNKMDVVVDVGANIGFVSFLYALSGAKNVHSFEPFEDIYSYKFNPDSNSKNTFYPLALTDHNGSISFYKSAAHKQGNSCSDLMVNKFKGVFGDNPVTEVVNSARLDDFFEDEFIDFIKVDIEGSEASFIKGGTELLEKRQVKCLQIEVYDEMFHEVVPRLVEAFDESYCVCEDASGNYHLFCLSENNSLSQVRLLKRAMPTTYVFKLIDKP